MKRTKVYEKSLFRTAYNLPYDDMSRAKLFRSSKGDLSVLQRMRLIKNLPVHSGCVNTISWNETGEYLLSGSDDQHLVISDAFTHKVIQDFKTSHRANIFSAKFLPCIRDTRIVSCSGDGIILFTDLMMSSEPVYKPFNCHCGTAYEVATVPLDPHSFLSCGEDGTVRWYDLRVKDSCNRTNCQEDVMIQCQRAVTAMSVNLTAPFELAIGCSDSTVRLFDRRMLGTRSTGMNVKQAEPLCAFTVPSFKRAYRITSLCFSPEGEEILVSYSSDDLYLFSLRGKGSSQLKTTSALCKKGKLKLTSTAPTPVRRLRLRGDWSDTGPDARPERETGGRGDIAQARPTLHTPLMQHLTNVISRLLNDPATRAALTSGVDASGTTQETVSIPPDASDARNENEVEDASDDQSGSPRRTDDHNSPQVYERDLQEYELFEEPSTSYDSLPSTSRDVSVLSEEDNAVVDCFETPFDFCAPTAPAVAPPQNEYKIAPLRDPEDRVDQNSCDSPCGHSTVSIPGAENEGNKALFAGSNAAVLDSQNFDGVEKMHESSDNQCESNQLIDTPNDTVESSDPDCEQKANSLDRTPTSTDKMPGTQVAAVSSHVPTDAEVHENDIKSSQSSEISRRRRQKVDSRVSPPPGTNTSMVSSKPEEETVVLDGDRASISNGSILSSVASSQPPTLNEGQECYPEPAPSEPEIQQNFESTKPETKREMEPERARAPEPELDLDAEAGPSVQNFGSSSDSMSDRVSLFSDYDSEEDEEDLRRELRSRIAPPGLGHPLRSSHEIPFPEIKQQFSGHRNARTMIKEASFWGTDYVMSGSDCGHVFIWDRSTAKLVMLLQADQHVVNCLQPHPTEPLLATSGIDNDVKLWAPVGDGCRFDQNLAVEIVKRNALMLEETRDTITVPASFMIRMVACLNQIRRDGRTRSRRRTQESDDE